MATVWAPYIARRLGQWQEAPESGWSHTISFSSLGGLCEAMQQRHLRGAVTRLGIVAHGDSNGLVQLDRNLTRQSLATFRPELNRLRYFLTPDAQFTFYSCLAGAGQEGSSLLIGLSGELPGRTIMGFTVYGETDANEALSMMSQQTPGRVREAPFGQGSGRSGAAGLLRRSSEYCKMARGGIIIRQPVLERDQQNHCANPHCPGHGNPRDNCPGWH